MDIASGWRERTHKDKLFIFSQIGDLDRQRTHSEYRLYYQLLAAISRPISANFEWMRPSDCRIASDQGSKQESHPNERPVATPGTDLRGSKRWKVDSKRQTADRKG